MVGISIAAVSLIMLSGCEESPETNTAPNAGAARNTSKQIGNEGNSSLGAAKRSAEKTVADVEKRSQEVAKEADKALDPDHNAAPEPEPKPD